MARPSLLESKLTEFTREFVTKIVATIRNASFAEVAHFTPERLPVTARKPASVPQRQSAPARLTRSESGSSKSDRSRRPRQTADKRAELGDRILEALGNTSEPIGVRALASELGVAADLLAAPLRELRASGKITKHGDKRNSSYSLS